MHHSYLPESFAKGEVKKRVGGKRTAESDEYVKVEEFIDVVKSHVLSAYDCLRQTE